MSLFDEFTDDPEVGAFDSANQVITQIRDIFKTTQQVADVARTANDFHAGAYSGQIVAMDQWIQQAESSLAAATFQFNSLPGPDTSRSTAGQPLMRLLREQADRLPDHIHSRVENTDPGDQRKSLALGMIESTRNTHETLNIVIRIIHRGRVTNPMQQSLGSIVRHSIKMLESTLSTLDYACRIPTVVNKVSVSQGITRGYDVFICHASEDKDDVVRELASHLQESGLEVWYDEWAMTIGDNLSQKISEWLAQSTFGVVVISPHFPNKQWQQQEFYALLSQLIAEKLKTRMLFVRSERNDRRMAHEFLERLISDGKKCFQKRSGSQYVANTDAIIAIEAADQLLVSWGNRASHTFDVVRPEAIKLIDACEAALATFHCSSCSPPCYVWRLDDGNAEWVQCRCGELRWRYGKA